MGVLDGRRALVIGAGSGIGRAVAHAYLREGAQLTAADLSAAKCETLRGELPGAEIVQADATSLAQTGAAVAAAAGPDGRLDVLVNCVGVFDFYTGLGALDAAVLDEAFTEAFQTNVKSQLVSVKTALPALRVARGSVILTVSTSGFYPGRGGILYVASKFAVRGCVTALAHELAPEIRVNGVAPGGTLGTDLRGLASLDLEGRRLEDTPGRAGQLRGRTPLEVALSAEDHAGSYVFLASAAARGMTGTFLHPDGGIGVKT